MKTYLLADVVVAGLAGPALPTAIQGLDRDAVPDLGSGHPFADFDDRAGELVSEHERHLLVSEGVRFGGYEDRPRVVLVEVGTADPVEPDLDLHLPLAR